ncbi:hypothetical protein GCM10023093_12320 [Nemorincola caseinilytica]|uniref:Ig-like domain-containing protein n=1 Tax=Nemorincola caseinilytica TaxID=2054315 RepID=A0ABP8N9I2_9BACT
MVTTDPVADTACSADHAWFHVAATGTAPLTFMWEYSNDGGTSWDTTADGSVYLGTYNDTLRVTADMSLNGYRYRCVVINTSGMDTSAAAILTVDTTAAFITGAMPVCEGGTIALANAVAGGTWSTLHPTISTIDAAGVVTGVDFGIDTAVYTVTNTCGISSESARIRVDSAMVPYPIMGPDQVCIGNSITLTNANVIGTHTWSTDVVPHSTISAAGVLTGGSAGIDTITYSMTNACNTVTVQAVVEVESLLAAGTISGASAVCAGSWTTLTATATGGMWISGNTSVAVVSTSGNVTGIGIGTSVISYYQSNSCGASVATHTITVDIPAAPIGGNDSVGIDSNLLLTNIVPGGVWTSTNFVVATIGSSSGMVHGEATGSAFIRYTVTNTCGTTVSSIVLHVGPLPSPGTLSGPDTVCTGGMITLTPSVAGGTWVSRHDTLATVTSGGVVTGVEAGKDTIDYYVTTAFGRSRVFKAVYVNEAPVITLTGPGSIALGGYYTLGATPTGGTFTSSNPGMAPLIGYGFFVVLDTGTSVFTYTKTNGCGTRSKTFTVHLPGTSDVRSVGAGTASLSIFPNPTQGALTVNLTSGVREDVVMILTNVTGQKVQEFIVPSNTATNVVIDQPAGIYMLTAVTKDGNRHSARITVAK